MQVTEADGRLFYELFVGLQLLVNRRHRVIEGVDTVEAFMALPGELRLECRRLLYAHPEHFDEFLEDGDLSASPDARQIVTGWRDHRVEGSFFVLRHLKKHSIFMASGSPPRAYGVLGLADPLEAFVPSPPAMVEAVLLPLRGRIIYDGFLLSSGPTLLFGGGIRRMLENEYREAKAHAGVITALPHDTPAGAPDDDARRLKALLKSRSSLERHWDEILELRSSSAELEALYHQERGKADARRIGRYLREAGVVEGWFAIFRGLVIASAPDRARLVKRVAEILPDSKASLPYLYRLKKK